MTSRSRPTASTAQRRHLLPRCRSNHDHRLERRCGASPSLASQHRRPPRGCPGRNCDACHRRDGHDRAGSAVGARRQSLPCVRQLSKRCGQSGPNHPDSPAQLSRSELNDSPRTPDRTHQSNEKTVMNHVGNADGQAPHQAQHLDPGSGSVATNGQIPNRTHPPKRAISQITSHEHHHQHQAQHGHPTAQAILTARSECHSQWQGVCPVAHLPSRRSTTLICSLVFDDADRVPCHALPCPALLASGSDGS